MFFLETLTKAKRKPTAAEKNAAQIRPFNFPNSWWRETMHAIRDCCHQERRASTINHRKSLRRFFLPSRED